MLSLCAMIVFLCPWYTHLSVRVLILYNIIPTNTTRYRLLASAASSAVVTRWYTIKINSNRTGPGVAPAVVVLHIRAWSSCIAFSQQTERSPLLPLFVTLCACVWDAWFIHHIILYVFSRAVSTIFFLFDSRIGVQIGILMVRLCLAKTTLLSSSYVFVFEARFTKHSRLFLSAISARVLWVCVWYYCVWDGVAPDVPI